MPKIAEDRKGTPTNSRVIAMAPGDRVTIKYQRLQAGDSFVSFYYIEKETPAPSDAWRYIGRFFTGDPSVTPPGGYLWRPARDAQGVADPLRPRPRPWCLRFDCFGLQLVRDSALGTKTLEVTPYASKVFEVRPHREYLFQFFRSLADEFLDTEVRVLFDYGGSDHA
jgi:hypothetical protein